MTRPHRKLRLTMAMRLFAVLAGIAPLLVVVAFVGYSGLRSLNRETDTLFNDNLKLAVSESALSRSLGQVESASLEELAADGKRNKALRATVRDGLIADIDSAFWALLKQQGKFPEKRVSTARAVIKWRTFVAYSDAQPLSRRLSSHEISLRSQKTTQMLDPLAAWATRSARLEQEEATRTFARAGRTFDRGRLLILVITALALAVGGFAATALIRSIIPRLREYSRFAAQVAKGDLTGWITPRGTDELAMLGRVLNDMVSARARADRISVAQAEFVETLQYSETEEAAYSLIKHHLERALPGASTVILRSNNSSDRLEPTTPLPDRSPLLGPLDGARPESCLAVKFGRPHENDASVGDPLLHCAVCGKLAAAAACRPLMVGGKVLGAVLVQSTQPLVAEEQGVFTTSVSDAAPVLANLQTLAIAELRAATDSLTGLPNDRSVREAVKRMVAEASRRISPVAAIALDLDHFKQINDTYGHGVGDEVLQAVGVTLRTTIRASDFAGRFGGEEFLILLPDTSTEGAALLAEKLRAAIGRIEIPGIDRLISASLGVAVLLEHAASVDALLKAADHALYAAKHAGRNRVVVAEGLEPDPDRGVAGAFTGG
ncbi:MAG: hypothetical protein QOJ29_4903 [Thermoleophilaceae bacterium]|jgi:diguanylate cyclase (GGDEF)-like protein|nr:hypothetical protein [Thermoleophilaceae bacterium]